MMIRRFESGDLAEGAAEHFVDAERGGGRAARIVYGCVSGRFYAEESLPTAGGCSFSRACAVAQDSLLLV